MNQIATSLTLPEDLDAQIRKLAKKRGQTKTGLIRDAVRRYIADREFDDTVRELRARALAMGIHTEDDVDRLIHEYRREQSQKTKRA